MAVEKRDKIVAESAPVLEQTVLDVETFQVWKSELNDFIAVTRNRLQSLSQSLSQPVQTISQDNREIGTQSETIASTATDSDLSPRIVVQIDPPAEQPSDPGSDSLENAVVDEDPMQRLNAIKLRLARQMQNPC